MCVPNSIAIHPIVAVKPWTSTSFFVLKAVIIQERESVFKNTSGIKNCIFLLSAGVTVDTFVTFVMLKPPFGWFTAQFFMFHSTGSGSAARFIWPDWGLKHFSLKMNVLLLGSSQCFCSIMLTICTILIFTGNDFSRTEPEKSQTLIKTSRSHSSHVCVLELYFSLMFIFMQGELKCNTLTSGRLISHEAVVHHCSSGVALQGSNGIRCGNRSGQR